jgi:DNA-binding CsgD family transcriptional regulator
MKPRRRCVGADKHATVAAREHEPPPTVIRRFERAPRALTRREHETLQLLMTDASEKAIAARLGISAHTVHDHVKRVYRKLGVSSRPALMALTSAPPMTVAGRVE